MRTRLSSWLHKLKSLFCGVCSNQPSSPSPSPVKKAELQPPSAATPAKPRYNAADFTFSKIIGGSAIKLPGQLPEGAPFDIVECEKSTLLLLDCTAQVTIDACRDCIIVVGPCDGSVFVRDCERCTIIVATRQFRLRNGRLLHLSLYCATDPVIEASEDVKFSCFSFTYKELEDQFAKAKLPILKNQWSQIYDFSDSSNKNFTLTSPLTRNDLNLTLNLQEKLLDYEQASPVVPVVYGRMQPPSDQRLAFISFADDDTTIKALRTVQESAKILHIRERKYAVIDIERFFENPGVKDMAKAADHCMVAELHIGSESLPTWCVALPADIYISPSFEAGKRDLTNIL
ncbi:tubulin binding cofactor C-domain-containing protein [Gaertneriomyces semiglobifer]|nr:tubulin binding cofactor C-domain-containing protein [Gaertneriomyces semiglobifer]